MAVSRASLASYPAPKQEAAIVCRRTKLTVAHNGRWHLRHAGSTNL